MTTQTYTIRESTQLVLNDVHIAAGNFIRSDYVDENGLSQQGITAMLWVLVPSHPPQRRRVHIGQDIRIGAVQIQVIEIGTKDGWGFVQLSIAME